MESGSNDPAAYMLTIIVLSMMNGTASGGSILLSLFSQIVFGGLCGVLIAQLAAFVFRNISFTTNGFDSLFVFAIAIASYAIPSLIGGNGYLSAYIVGVILGNEDFRDKKALVHFFDGITGLMQMLVFFLLGLLAKPALLHKAILPALAIFLFMLFVARPAAVFGILTPFRKYPFRQMALISFVGLRGAASIVFAIMAMVDPALIQNDIFNIVFMVVLLSIALQGSLIPFVAKRLDMVDPNANVMKTFNDYTEDTGLNFGRIPITSDSSWSGRSIRDLGLPHNVLIALVVRGDRYIQPNGDTVLVDGDEVITLTKDFNDASVQLREKTIKKGSRRVGHKIAETHGPGLIVMVRRGERNMIPSGDTILEEGDKVVILQLKQE